MVDYDEIKELARKIGQPVTDLLALSARNDPFYAGVSSRGVAARWFADISQEHGGASAHLRRIHYKLVSQRDSGVTLPSGKQYQNTEADWKYLCWASLSARYLNLVPFDSLVDRRNAAAIINAADANPDQVLAPTCETFGEFTSFEPPEFPNLPTFSIGGFDAVQNYIVEVWIEKSTQNDWLEPLCSRRGVNLVVEIGEQSETRSRELAERAAGYSAPVRVLYMSDFDPAGRSMPKAVARKVEYTIQKFAYDIDFQLIPVGLSLEQCQQYELPRTPIKDTETRKSKFERTFNQGATELDALEALYPGEMARIVEGEIDNWLDRGLPARVRRVESEQELRLSEIVEGVRSQHEDAISAMREQFKKIVADLREWEQEADELWGEIASDLEDYQPNLDAVTIPRSEAPGETDKFVLFDSKRDYLTQMDAYNKWKDGDDADG